MVNPLLIFNELTQIVMLIHGVVCDALSRVFLVMMLIHRFVLDEFSYLSLYSFILGGGFWDRRGTRVKITGIERDKGG